MFSGVSNHWKTQILNISCYSNSQTNKQSIQVYISNKACILPIRGKVLESGKRYESMRNIPWHAYIVGIWTKPADNQSNDIAAQKKVCVEWEQNSNTAIGRDRDIEQKECPTRKRRRYTGKTESGWKTEDDAKRQKLSRIVWNDLCRVWRWWSNIEHDGFSWEKSQCYISPMWNVIHNTQHTEICMFVCTCSMVSIYEATWECGMDAFDFSI